MSDTNDLSHPTSSSEESFAPSRAVENTDILNRLIELENDITAHKANVEAHSKNLDTDRELLDRVKAGERWMIGITILIFLVSVFQAYESWSNNRSTGKQVEQIIDAGHRLEDAGDSFSSSSASMSRSMNSAVAQLGTQATNIENARKSSVEEAEKSLKASAKATNITIQATRDANRAYVFPVMSAWRLFPCPTTLQRDWHPKYCAGFEFHNLGETPASNVTVIAAVHAGNGEGLDPNSFAPCLGNTKHVLFKSDSDTCSMQAVGESDIAQFQVMGQSPEAGKQSYIAHGRIEFDDIYSDHHTEPFCFLYPRISDSDINRPHACTKAEGGE